MTSAGFIFAEGLLDECSKGSAARLFFMTPGHPSSGLLKSGQGIKEQEMEGRCRDPRGVIFTNGSF
jgi:hypothetical protein